MLSRFQIGTIQQVDAEPFLIKESLVLCKHLFFSFYSFFFTSSFVKWWVKLPIYQKGLGLLRGMFTKKKVPFFIFTTVIITHTSLFLEEGTREKK